MNPLREFSYRSKYSRWRPDLGRREVLPESVARYVNQLDRLARGNLARSELRAIEREFLALSALGSMRLLAMAGAAFERDNACAYNCAALAFDRLEALHDAVILSMSGAGVTYSVEARHISKLPVVAARNGVTAHYQVPDTTEGWAAAVLFAARAAFAGQDVALDYSLIRPAGAILKTKGGRASGPDPLLEAIAAIVAIIHGAAGRRLTSVEASDAMCWVGNASVLGGVRRTAMMALFDYGDTAMREAKSAGWWERAPVRGNANLSEVWPADAELSPRAVAESLAFVLEGDTGEPGFFNRRAALIKLRLSGRPVWDTILVNPCGEALLYPFSLCNLTAVVARPDSTRASLLRSAEIAALMGTVQAVGTHFPSLLIPDWQQNCERERLLGVGVTGFMDSAESRRSEVMAAMRAAVVETNHRYAERLGIAPAAAHTAVKPAGNSGLLTDSAPGVNARHYPYSIRRVTLNETEPLYEVLRESGVPMERKAGGSSQWYAVFPVAAPPGAITQDDLTAVQQLEFIRRVSTDFANHAVSATVSYLPSEIPAIVDYVYRNQAALVGATFFRKDTQYHQAIVERITCEEYERRAAEFPAIRWELLNEIEREDHTTAAQEVSCAGGQCDARGEIMPGFRL